MRIPNFAKKEDGGGKNTQGKRGTSQITKR